MSAGPSASWLVFSELLEKANKRFNRLRDLPPNGPLLEAYYHKAFQVFSLLWKFQQDNRHAEGGGLPGL